MKHIKNLIAYVKHMIKRELEVIVESVKFSGKIIINIKNRKMINVIISKLKIKPFFLVIYQSMDNDDLENSNIELNPGRDPPKIFPFRSLIN